MYTTQVFVPDDGYRFLPTDEELVTYYLYRKMTNQPLPNGVIVECDLYGNENPWEIWQSHIERVVESEEGEDLYFFTWLKRKKPEAKHVERRVGLGTWSGENGSDISKMFGGTQSIVVGSKKRFRFEKSGTNHDGGWIMHEYSLNHSLLHPNFKSIVDTLVLCRIRKNKRVIRQP